MAPNKMGYLNMYEFEWCKFWLEKNSTGEENSQIEVIHIF